MRTSQEYEKVSTVRRCRHCGNAKVPLSPERYCRNCELEITRAFNRHRRKRIAQLKRDMRID